MTIRKMVPDEAPVIEGILALSPRASAWSASTLLSLLNSGARVWVADEEGELVGTVAARTIADEVEILNLGVVAPWRRRGLGHSLMAVALEEAGQAGAKQAFLEVRESNEAARAFYIALGFTATGRRRGYYREPPEDALVFSRPLEERLL